MTLKITNWRWVRSWNCGCLVIWFCYQLIAKPGNKTATVPWPDPDLELNFPWGQRVPLMAQRMVMHPILSAHNFKNIWVMSRRCGCLVTWFCYHLIAKPGNKTAALSWPDPYTLSILELLCGQTDWLDWQLPAQGSSHVEGSHIRLTPHGIQQEDRSYGLLPYWQKSISSLNSVINQGQNDLKSGYFVLCKNIFWKSTGRWVLLQCGILEATFNRKSTRVKAPLKFNSCLANLGLTFLVSAAREAYAIYGYPQHYVFGTQ